MKEMINVEAKHIDTVTAGTVIDSSGLSYALSLTAQGDSDEQRNGNSIKAHDILARLQFYRDTASTSAFDLIRCLLLEDTMQDGALPTTAQLLDAVTITSPRQTDTILATRFRVIEDKNYELYGNKPVIIDKMYHKLPNHIHYKGTAADQASQGPGNMYLFLLCNNAVSRPKIDINCRIKYYDN